MLKKAFDSLEYGSVHNPQSIDSNTWDNLINYRMLHCLLYSSILFQNFYSKKHQTSNSTHRLLKKKQRNIKESLVKKTNIKCLCTIYPRVFPNMKFHS